MMNKAAARDTGDGRFGSVLVVDDVPGLRALYSGLLEQRSDVEVVGEAGDGRAAIEAAREHQPDLILLDLSMPEMDGLEALPRIKDASPGSEVVVLSGFLEERLGDEALARGAAAYLEKTGEPDRLLPRLQDALADKGRIRGYSRHGDAPPEGDARVQTRPGEGPSTPSDEELSTFAYAASHDLQEPLRMVGSYVDVLRDRLEGRLEDEETFECLDHVESGVERMSSMVDGLLQYSRVDTRPEDAEAIDLEEVVDDVLGNLSLRLEETGAHVARGPLPRVEAAPGQLVVLLQNLVTNAITYHDGTPSIEIGAERREDEVEVYVADDGPGIPEKDQARVFSLFQRGDTAGGETGSGIGLAICKRVVERHGGAIWIESEEDQGTTVRFTLPAAEADRGVTR